MLVNTMEALMSHEQPTPPTDLPTDIVGTLDRYSSERLQHVARYAEALAEHRVCEARVRENSDKEETGDPPDCLPDDVPAKATITTKEINDNQYYDWQWREGDKVRSKYIEPVDPAE